MKVVILQSNYLPWRGYFNLIHQADIFCFYDEVQYTKNDWRNRNRIQTAHGVRWLTIPISSKAVKLTISEVKFKDSSWQEKHFDILYQAYKDYPYFKELEIVMVDFYRNHEWQTLSELNQYTIKYLSDYLELKTTFVNSAEYNLKNGRIERLISLVEQLGGTEYITGPAAKDYLQSVEHLFIARNIKVTYLNYENLMPYPQKGAVFENYLSIIDLMACVSKEACRKYICL